MTSTRKSISAKITWMNMLVSGTALLLAGASFFAYDQVTFRQGLVHSLSAQAQIVASNSVSALVFNDPQSAANTLFALNSSPSIESAAIFTASGNHSPATCGTAGPSFQRSSISPAIRRKRTGSRILI